MLLHQEQQLMNALDMLGVSGVATLPVVSLRHWYKKEELDRQVWHDLDTRIEMLKLGFPVFAMYRNGHVNLIRADGHTAATTGVGMQPLSRWITDNMQIR